MLESFGESPKACVINSSRPPEKLKGKENPDLPSVCSNYWPPNVALSLCFNHLVLSTFWQCRSAIPKRSAKPIASIQYPPHSTVPLEKHLRELIICLSLTWLSTEHFISLYFFTNVSKIHTNSHLKDWSKKMGMLAWQVFKLDFWNIKMDSSVTCI